MYPVSQAYKNAIASDVISDKIVGSITLVDDTVINITSDDIFDGTLSLSESCVSGGDIEIGSVVAAELNFAMISDDPYKFDGARIALQYGLETSEGVFEYVPLGVFYVDDPKRRTDSGVAIKAFDGMMVLDKEIDYFPPSSSPFTMLSWICSINGLSLSSTTLEVSNFPNGTEILQIPDESPMKTYRDLLMWIAQATGCFARFNRLGGLELVPVCGRAAVRTLEYTDQFDGTEVSDNYIKITRLTTSQNGIPIIVGMEGLTMELDENPLWSGDDITTIESKLQNILNSLTTAEYTPGTVLYVGDPSIQPGDYISVKRSAGDASPATLYITSSSWNPHGKHTLKAEGNSGIRRSKYSQTDKKASQIQQLLDATKQLAESASAQADLLNNAVGGNVFIRQTPGLTNEILIMDDPDPELAVKIWRWNLNGLGYSNNVTGADNPARTYTTAMTIDGAISANFITTGVLRAILLEAVEINCNDRFIVAQDGTVTAAAGNIGGWNITKDGLFQQAYDGTVTKVWDDTNCIVYRDNEWAQGVVAYFKQDVAAAHSRTYKIDLNKKYLIGCGQGTAILFSKTPIVPDAPIYEGFWVEPTGALPIDNDNSYDYLTFVGINIHDDIANDWIHPEHDSNIPAGIWKNTAGYKGYKQLAWGAVVSSGRWINYSEAVDEANIVLHTGQEPSKVNPGESKGFYTTESELTNAPNIIIGRALWGDTDNQVYIDKYGVNATKANKGVEVSGDGIFVKTPARGFAISFDGNSIKSSGIIDISGLAVEGDTRGVDSTVFDNDDQNTVTKFSNGLMIQSGVYALPSGVPASTITGTISYNDNFLYLPAVTLSVKSDTASGEYAAVQLTAVNNFECGFAVLKIGANSIIPGQTTVHWQAIGRWK